MFSVIIPTYNRKNFIGRSIQSVLEQTYKDFEIIIVDDGSCDGTEEFVKNTFNDPIIRYFKFDNNRGPGEARNKGIAEARGKYFMIWDSDDSLYNYALEKISNIFRSNPGVAVVSAPAKIFINNKEADYKKYPSGIIQKEDIICKLVPSNFKIRVAKSEKCKDVRYVSRNIDFLFNVSLAERGDWYHINEYLGEVYNQEDEYSLTKIRKKSNIELSKERAPYLYNYLITYRKLLSRKSPSKYAAFTYGASLGLLLDNKKRQATELLIRAIRYHPKDIRNSLLLLLALIPFSKFFLELLFKTKISILNK